MQPTKVEPNGRVLIPAAIRRALGLRAGSELLLTLEDDARIVFVTPANAWARVQSLVDDSAPRGSVVDELLVERRAEARQETAGRAVDDPLSG